MDTAWTGSGAPHYGRLQGNEQADVVIIGGGLTGVLCAYLLSEVGKSVVLLEKGTLGEGATAHTTAFVSQSIDTALADLTSMFGADGARMVWAAGAAAIGEIARIAQDESIACELVRCPARVYAKSPRQYRTLQAEADAASRLGFAVSLRKDGALHFPNEGYLEVPDQAKFHPLQFLYRLAAHAARAGVRIHEHTEVAGLSESGEIVVTAAGGATVRAGDVIVATHLPFNNPKATHFKKGVYRSYVLEAHTGTTGIPEGIYWDLNRPYDYFRVDRWDDGDRIIVGGADHRQEIPVPRSNINRVLERNLKDILGDAAYRVIRTWSGPIIESSDGLPLIGEYAPHRYVATAFSGNGMTYAAVSAMVFRDLITGRTNPWAGLFDPKRSLKPYRLWRKGLDYVREFAGGMRNWFR